MAILLRLKDEGAIFFFVPQTSNEGELTLFTAG